MHEPVDFTDGMVKARYIEAGGDTEKHTLGNGWNTVSRVLFRRRELTEPH